MAKKETTKLKKTPTEKLTTQSVLENIANDVVIDEVKEIVEQVEKVLPNEDLITINETTSPEEIIPQLTQKMEELDAVKETIEKTMKDMSKKLSNSQITYMWNGVNLFE